MGIDTRRIGYRTCDAAFVVPSLTAVSSAVLKVAAAWGFLLTPMKMPSLRVKSNSFPFATLNNFSTKRKFSRLFMVPSAAYIRSLGLRESPSAIGGTPINAPTGPVQYFAHFAPSMMSAVGILAPEGRTPVKPVRIICSIMLFCMIISWQRTQVGIQCVETYIDRMLCVHRRPKRLWVKHIKSHIPALL